MDAIGFFDGAVLGSLCFEILLNEGPLGIALEDFAGGMLSCVAGGLHTLEHFRTNKPRSIGVGQEGLQVGDSGGVGLKGIHRKPHRLDLMGFKNLRFWILELLIASGILTRCFHYGKIEFHVFFMKTLLKRLVPSDLGYAQA